MHQPRRITRISRGFLSIGLLLAFLWYIHTPLFVTVYATRLPSGPLFVSEDPLHPRLARLRQQEQLDRVLQGSPSDLERLLRLAQWTSQQFNATSPFPNYPPWDALEILDRIRRKQTGGFCAQYALVFGQACESLGYGVRFVGVVNQPGKSGHALTEVYVPSLSRWVAFEPEFGRYYTDTNGKALSGLDLHFFAVGKRRGSILQVPSKKPMARDWLSLFYNYKFWLRNNFISVPVYHYYQPRDGGRELVFEGYQLRWQDAQTANAHEAVPSLHSNRVEDFDFPFDLNRPTEDWICRTPAEFARFAEQAVPLKLYRLQLPAALLTQIVEQVFVQNPRFAPLR